MQGYPAGRYRATGRPRLYHRPRISRHGRGKRREYHGFDAGRGEHVMTLADIKALVLAADPDACAYESDSTGKDYTTWQPLWPMNLFVDNRCADGWHFVIDRFTRMQDDPVTANIRAVLDDAPGVAYAMEIDYERDTGFIHISFTCDGV
nr:MAG TPA: hypothetical protein [Caudoviricetes sp.]